MLLLYFHLTYARRFYSLQHLLYLTKRNDTSSLSFKMLTMTMQLYLQMKVHVIKGKRVSWLKAVTRDQHSHRGRAKTLSSLSPPSSFTPFHLLLSACPHVSPQHTAAPKAQQQLSSPSCWRGGPACRF